MATKEKSEIKIGKHVVSITNRQKIYWPDEGFTKGDLIDYYDKMADSYPSPFERKMFVFEKKSEWYK